MTELKKILEAKGVWEKFAEDIYRMKWEFEKDLNYIKIFMTAFKDNVKTTSYFWFRMRDEFVISKLKYYERDLKKVLNCYNPNISNLEEDFY